MPCTVVKVNKLKLHLFLEFASTRILPKTCPALS